jgi:F0F1-type ATP synthase assembly protein I
MLAATAALGVLLGHLADERWRTTPAFTITGAVAGIAIAMYNFFRTVMRRP